MTSKEIRDDFMRKTRSVSSNSKKGRITFEQLAFDTIEDILNLTMISPPKLAYAREVRRGNVILRKRKK